MEDKVIAQHVRIWIMTVDRLQNTSGNNLQFRVITFLYGALKLAEALMSGHDGEQWFKETHHNMTLLQNAVKARQHAEIAD